MACFMVPMGEAVVTSVAHHVVSKKEKQAAVTESAGTEKVRTQERQGVPFSRKLTWLNAMLWGGTGVLVLEHILHGELTYYFPFFTAAMEPGGWSLLLQEMATVGLAMALLVTLVWGGMLAVSAIRTRRGVNPMKRTSFVRQGAALAACGAVLMVLVDVAVPFA